MLLGTKIILGSSLISILLGVGFYFYHDYTQTKMERTQQELDIEKANVKKALDNAAALKKSHEEFKKEYEISKQKIEDLDERTNAARQNHRRLESLIRNTNVNQMGNEDPSLLEDNVNALSNDVFNRFNELSNPKVENNE